MLGSLSGATWPKLATLAPVLALALIACVWIARGLDVLVLGEAEAFHSGVDVERLKRISIVLVSAMTGVAVSVCGVVGFVDRGAALPAGDRAGAPGWLPLDAFGRCCWWGRYAVATIVAPRKPTDPTARSGRRSLGMLLPPRGWFRYDAILEAQRSR